MRSTANIAPLLAATLAGNSGNGPFSTACRYVGASGPAASSPKAAAKAATDPGARGSTVDRNAHWSLNGSRVVGSKKSVVPRLAQPPCRGRAMRFPKEPLGIKSWAGNNRS